MPDLGGFWFTYVLVSILYQMFGRWILTRYPTECALFIFLLVKIHLFRNSSNSSLGMHMPVIVISIVASFFNNRSIVVHLVRFAVCHGIRHLLARSDSSPFPSDCCILSSGFEE